MNRLFKRCPKSNKIVGFNYASRWFWVISPIVACLAFLWFLIRVIPKPQRAAYPCQRVAVSLFGGFFTYLAGATCIGVFLHRAKKLLSNQKISASLACILIAVLFLSLTWGGNPSDSKVFSAAEGGYASFVPPDGPNAPVGTGKGIYPGRVVFVRDEAAVKYNGTGDWWDDKNTDPAVVEKLFAASLTELTGRSSAEQSWSALFHHYNLEKNGIAADYQAGEKIVIKLNQNQDKGTGWGKSHMTSPQLLDALLADLTGVVGVHPSDITLIDASRSFSDSIYNRVIEKFPGVRMVAQNRIKPVRNTQYPVRFAGDEIPTGYLPSDYIDAKYMINIGMFRVHNMYGITLCGKNHFGSVDFDNADRGKFLPTPMHVSWNNDYDSYSPLTDLITHDMIGGKTFLYLIDAFYASDMQNNPIVTNLQSFGGKTPCGIFASQDPVAIDSVGLDFLACEPNLSVRGANGTPDNYLHESARLRNPPSGTKYDPNGTGIIPRSLGVHEHWNNSVDKLYSRNLGKSEGIEFIQRDFTARSAEFTVSRLTLNGQDLKDADQITGSGRLTGTVRCKNLLGPAISPLISVSVTETKDGVKQTVSAISVRSPVIPTEGEKDITFTITIPQGLQNAQLSLYIWNGLSMNPYQDPKVWKVM